MTRPALSSGVMVVVITIVFATGHLQAQPATAGDDDSVVASDLVTLEAEHIKLSAAIQLLIRNRDINIVTGETLDHDVTVKFRKLPWRQALANLLSTHGYSALESDGVLKIVRLDQPKETATRTVPLHLTFEHIDAHSAKLVLENVLSPAGKIIAVGQPGAAGSSLTVIDTVNVLETVRGLVAEIDRPPREKSASLEKNDDGTIDLRLVDFPLAEVPQLFKKSLALNIFVHAPLSGIVNVELSHIPWQDALGTMLEHFQLGLRAQGEYYVIDEIEHVRDQLITRDFRLRFIDGWDVKPYVEAMLSEKGKVACFSPSPRAGFRFGSKITEQREQDKVKADSRRATSLSVTDRAAVIARVAQRVAELDREPQQIEVNVRIVQLTRSTEQRTGIDWNTVLSIAGSERPTTLPFGRSANNMFPGPYPDPTAADFAFGTLSAVELSAVLRLIREQNDAEIVSEPNITTLDNIEASILIGRKFPVTTETIDPQTAVRTVTLDYYEDIGIQLLVVPSISEDGHIHLVIHPAVSTLAELIDDRFPVIQTREADTQVILGTGETVVIGGLVEHQKEEREGRVPIIGDIPWFGELFTYRTHTESDTELVILVTPRLLYDRQTVEDSLILDPERVERLRELRDMFEGVLDR